MSAPRRDPTPPRRATDGSSRLLALAVGRDGRPRPDDAHVDAFLVDWHRASGTSIGFDEWCDPAARYLAAVFGPGADLAVIEEAVVAFAQARAGADHSAAAVAGDLVALARLAWPSSGHEWDGWIDPLGLLARALGAWAAERVAVASSVDCVDPATGLVTARFLERRLQELHAQCDALAISPPLAFGSVVVQLGLGAVAASERVAVRVAAGRILAQRFRAGETVAALSSSRTMCRMAAVMPAYGVDRALADVRSGLAGMAKGEGVEQAVGRVPFGATAGSTFTALMHSPVG
jgi:hypothetical protein